MALQRRVSAVRLAFGRNSIRGRIQKMTAPGKLIAVEGIDGSGKRTQVELLTLSLKARGHSVYSTGFPQYHSWFGKMVGQFLNGDLGPLESVDPHFTAMLYAATASKPSLNSNPPEQRPNCSGGPLYRLQPCSPDCSRSPTQRSEFLKWIEHLEYMIYGLPRETLALYLRVPPQKPKPWLLASPPAATRRSSRICWKLA